MIDKFPGKVSRVSGKIYFTPEQQRWLADTLQWRTVTDVAREIGIDKATLFTYVSNHKIKRLKRVTSESVSNLARERGHQFMPRRSFNPTVERQLTNMKRIEDVLSSDIAELKEARIFTPDPPSKCIGSKCWLFHRTDRTGSPLPCAKKGVCHAIF